MVSVGPFVRRERFPPLRALVLIPSLNMWQVIRLSARQFCHDSMILFVIIGIALSSRDVLIGWVSLGRLCPMVENGSVLVCCLVQ